LLPFPSPYLFSTYSLYSVIAIFKTVQRSKAPMKLSVETVVGVDAEAARKEEEEMMLRDANQWLNAGCYDEQPHPKTGAYALHVAAAKGYISVIK